MRLIGEKVTLRDFHKKDIQKRMFWETEQTEWQLWDAPWEYEAQNNQNNFEWLVQYQNRLERQAEDLLTAGEKTLRRGFEIELTGGSGESIGWCNSYFLKDDFIPAPDGKLLAIGIDLPDPNTRGRGYGSQALTLFLKYLFDAGFQELYTQTWSGNKPMVSLAARLGFGECARGMDARHVRGRNYDALTFRLKKSKFFQMDGIPGIN